MKRQKTLVVEDQGGPLEALNLTIRRVLLGEQGKLRFPKDAKQDLVERGVDVAQSYSEARQAIEQAPYDLIFLDHRLPYENQGNLERTDFDAFSRSLENIGYSLIPQIRQRLPQGIIIGTSSLDSRELRQFGEPDYRIDKISMTLDEDLAKILEQIPNRNERRLE
jgi:CheY-like chemotaxis protein